MEKEILDKKEIEKLYFEARQNVYKSFNSFQNVEAAHSECFFSALKAVNKSFAVVDTIIKNLLTMSN
ncbi:MAG: hypothetical protein KHX03_08630 [Clostridium sp.]|nr:hypothetical protein [Clostridium sp.]